MTTPATSGPTDLTFDEIKSLEHQNLCQRSVATGKRKVSAAFLSPPSSVPGSLSSSSSSSASVRTRNFNTGSFRNFDIPTTAESADALEFIGFTAQAASSIAQNYQSRPNPSINSDSFIDYVYGHVSRLNSPRLAALSARQAMSQIGLTSKQQDALMDPRFTRIFWTESLYFWVKDTLRINYGTLLQLQRRLKNHARTGGQTSRRPSVQGAFNRPGELLPPTENEPPEINMTVNMTPEDYHLPANHIALGSQGEILPNHLVLWKGKAAAEMLDSQWIQNDGSINMAAIASYSGGDFNHNKTAWYWTAEREVAELYRQWAARRCSWSETWLIRIQIPDRFLNTLKREELWFSPDWKEYVWCCKKRRNPPPNFDHLWREGRADVVRGHICTGTNNTITRIEKEDVQTKITTDNLLMIESTNRRAVQYVFMQSDSVERLGEAIRGKIYLEITGAAQVQESS